MDARRDVLRKVAHTLHDRAVEIATLIARESGKAIAQARGEVARAVSTFELASEEATRIGGEVVPLDLTAVAAPYSGSWARIPSGPVLGIAPLGVGRGWVAGDCLSPRAGLVLRRRATPHQAPRRRRTSPAHGLR
jgi:hypothetical protein